MHAPGPRTQGCLGHGVDLDCRVSIRCRAQTQLAAAVQPTVFGPFVLHGNLRILAATVITLRPLEQTPGSAVPGTSTALRDPWAIRVEVAH